MKQSLLWLAQGTRPLAYTLSGGRRTNRQQSGSSYDAGQSHHSPTERTASASFQAHETVPDTDVEPHQSTHSNKIPLPQLERPVYRVHYEDQSGDDEMTMEAPM